MSLKFFLFILVTLTAVNTQALNGTVNTTVNTVTIVPLKNLTENKTKHIQTESEQLAATELTTNNFTKSGKQINETKEVIGTVIIKSNDEGIDNNRGFFYRLINNFDRHTLIMVTAFLIGLILIGTLIAVSICICNSLNNSCGGLKYSRTNHNKGSADLATNPAYDTIKFVPNYDPDNHELSINNGEKAVFLQPSTTPLLNDKKNDSKGDHSLLNSTASLSCSSHSVNSAVFKTPNSIKLKSTDRNLNSVDSKKATDTIDTPKASNIRTSLTNMANKFSSTPSKTKKNDESISENERSCLLDETDSTELVHNDSAVRKPLFTSQPKTGQQIMREQKLNNKSAMHPPQYTRTQSEVAGAADGKEERRHSITSSNNRLSTASSRNSLIMNGVPLNFDQIKDDIDDLAVNKQKLVSTTNLHSSSQNASQIIHMDKSDSMHNSIADIYIQELLNKHQESNHKNPIKKKKNSMSSNSIISDARQKRDSINIDVSKINFSTNPSVSVTNLDRNTSASVYTVESEKSCY